MYGHHVRMNETVQGTRIANFRLHRAQRRIEACTSLKIDLPSTEAASVDSVMNNTSKNKP